MDIIKRLALIAIFGFMLASAQSQNIHYQIEPNVVQVLEKHQEAWNNVNNVSGFRIQILALTGTNARVRTLKIKEEFGKLFSGISCHVSYIEPNFRIRVGDFRTRLDALYFLEAIQLKYPGAFIVKEQVSFSDI